VNQFINQISNYDPEVIQGTLLQVAAAAISNGSFSIATSTFNMTLQSLPSNSTNTLTQDGVHVEIPPLPVEGGAASLIQWKTNPYQGASEIVPDSSVVSISVISTNGSKVAVSGLEKPISFNLPLTIKPNDPRFLPPPLYLVLCSVNKIMINKGNAFIPFSGANLTTNTTWAVPCLLDSWQRVDCNGPVQEFQCPAPVITYECLYWDTNKLVWSGDGCTATVGSQSSITCACTHLTDFSSRIKAVVTSNIAVFNNAKNVYSESGLTKYAEWYGIFGGLGGACVLLCCIVMYIDIRSRRRYIHSLLRNEDIVKIMQEIPRVPISAYDRLETLQNLHKARKIETPIHTLNIFHRILQQHPFFQFIFRYDPRLTRVLRLMFICVIQFHSLFVTALFYGFTYGNKGAMSLTDQIILSAITTALNMPVVNLLIWAFNRIGNYEFQQQFPILYNEYMRRSNFEKMALVYLHKIGDKPNIGSLVFKAPAVKVPEEYLVENGDLTELDPKDILKKMAREIERIDRSSEDYSGFWSIFPTHSWQASLALSGLFGWLAWCLNYLLLFASANSVEVGHEVMTSWATSEITNIVVIQPLTIGATVLLYMLMNRYDKYIPRCIKKSKTVKSIPSLFYFSNPWNELSHSTLTSEFAYTIFVKCGAFASHSEELAYAPVNAIVSEVGEEKTITEEARVKELYDAMKKAYQELNE
jgi:GPCR proteolysis site, GPS, motif